MKKLLQKIAELDDRLKKLQPEKINLKERWDKHQWNKLDGGREEDEECIGMEESPK